MGKGEGGEGGGVRRQEREGKEGGGNFNARIDSVVIFSTFSLSLTSFL